MTVTASPRSAFRFCAETHTYRLGDRTLIGVTEALTLAGLLETRWYDVWTRERGSHLHQALAWLDRDELDEGALDPVLQPYVDAYRRFCADAHARWDFVELPLWDGARGYAGTIDRIGYLGQELVCLDIKTGDPEAWHALQLAGYVDLLRTAQYYQTPIIHRYGLYLKPDGSYRCNPYPDRQDETTFRAALVVAHWIKAHR